MCVSVCVASLPQARQSITKGVFLAQNEVEVVPSCSVCMSTLPSAGLNKCASVTYFIFYNFIPFERLESKQSIGEEPYYKPLQLPLVCKLEKICTNMAVMP